MGKIHAERMDVDQVNGRKGQDNYDFLQKFGTRRRMLPASIKALGTVVGGVVGW